MFALRKKSAIFGRGTRGETKKVNQICSWKLFMVTCPTKVDRYYQGNYIKELQRKWQVPKFSSRQNCYFWLYLGSRQNNNGTVIWFRNMLSINKFWKNGEVFLNLSTFCWYSDFLQYSFLANYGLMHWLNLDSPI